MHDTAMLMGVLLHLSGFQDSLEQFSRSFVVHHRAAQAERHEQVFRCFDGERRIVTEHESGRNYRLVSATRKGRSLPQAQIDAVTSAFRRLDAIYTIAVSCAGPDDLIQVFARSEGAQAELLINWRDGEVRVGDLAPADFLPAPRPPAYAPPGQVCVPTSRRGVIASSRCAPRR
jgi:hypothetical protein